jgi:hypothetical protein
VARIDKRRLEPICGYLPPFHPALEESPTPFFCLFLGPTDLDSAWKVLGQKGGCAYWLPHCGRPALYHTWTFLAFITSLGTGTRIFLFVDGEMEAERTADLFMVTQPHLEEQAWDAGPRVLCLLHASGPLAWALLAMFSTIEGRECCRPCPWEAETELVGVGERGGGFG